MKNLKLLLITIPVFFLLSCTNDSNNPLEDDGGLDPVPCEDGCLFTMQNATGTIIFMDCFQKYAIQTNYPDDPEMLIYGIPESLEESFHEVGKSVIFSAAFRENTLVPQFPDPSFNMESIFEIELFFIE